MRKLALLIVIFLVASFSVVAETDVPTICMTDRQIDEKIAMCKESGMSYKQFESEGCASVECVEFKNEFQCKINRDCPAINCIRAPCPQYICREGKCVLETSKCGNGICEEGEANYCPPCVSEGCMAPCEAGTCPTDCLKECPSMDMLEDQIADCRAKGMEYEKYFEGRCNYIRCIPSHCPGEDSRRASIEKCKKEGISYYEHIDGNGCKVVSCKVIEEIQCRKHFSDGCIKISCNDGYNFNSCEYKNECRTDCKKYTDEHGCYVKVCTDGYEERKCTTEEIKCEIVKTDDGCEIKKCTNGKEAKNCPIQQECKIYTDEIGCTVKECHDGYKKRECPESKEEKEVECKVYVDDKNCKIKACTNGLTINYCEQPSCKVEKDNEGCDVKTCDDGYVARNCPEKEEVECVVIKDTNSSCTVKICSDGFETKNCKELENAALAAAAQQSADEGSGFFGFFRRLFGSS